MTTESKTKLNLLLETSLFGFYYETDSRHLDKRKAIKLLFNKLTKKDYNGYITDYIYGELMEYKRKELFEELLKLYPLQVLNTQRYTENIEKLAKSLLKEKVIPKTKPDDALHLASGVMIPKIDILVSFNYKHIVNAEVIEKAKIITQKLGYKFNLEIYSPFYLVNI